MDKAGFVTYLLGKFSQEGNNIVVSCPFNFVNAFNARWGVWLIALFPDSLCGIGWNNTRVCLSITNMSLNLKPQFKFLIFAIEYM